MEERRETDKKKRETEEMALKAGQQSKMRRDNEKKSTT
jgi:hypothetical protein